MSTRRECASVSSPENALARSPIAPLDPLERDGWQLSARRSTAELTLSDQSPLSKVLVRAPFGGEVGDAVGARFGRAVRGERAGEPVLAVGSGPGEWLIVGPPGAAGTLLEDLHQVAAGSGEFASVVDLTHGRALIRIRGLRSADVLAKLCGIDLHDDATPDGTALRTSVAGLATDLVRDDRAAERSYLLHCERSSGQYLFDTLLDAGAEFGIEVTGLE